MFTLEPHQSQNLASLWILRLHTEQEDIEDGTEGALSPMQSTCSTHTHISAQTKCRDKACVCVCVSHWLQGALAGQAAGDVSRISASTTNTQHVLLYATTHSHQ